MLEGIFQPTHLLLALFIGLLLLLLGLGILYLAVRIVRIAWKR
jgi:hypothetical protein